MGDSDFETQRIKSNLLNKNVVNTYSQSSLIAENKKESIIELLINNILNN